MKNFIHKILYLSCMFGLLNTSYAALESPSDEELETLSAEIESPSIEPGFITEPEPQSTAQESPIFSSNKLAYNAYEQYLKKHIDDVEFKKLADRLNAENKIDELMQLSIARTNESKLLDILEKIQKFTNKPSVIPITLPITELLILEANNNYFGRLGIDQLLAYTIFVYCKEKLDKAFSKIVHQYSTTLDPNETSKFQPQVGKWLNSYNTIHWEIRNLNQYVTRALLHEINRVNNVWMLFDLLQVYRKIVSEKQTLTNDMASIINNYCTTYQDPSNPGYEELCAELYQEDMETIINKIEEAIATNK